MLPIKDQLDAESNRVRWTQREQDGNCGEIKLLFVPPMAQRDDYVKFVVAILEVGKHIR